MVKIVKGKIRTHSHKTSRKSYAYIKFSGSLGLDSVGRVPRSDRYNKNSNF